MCSPIFFRGRELKYYRAHYYPEEKTHIWEFLKESLGLVTRAHDTKTRVLIVPNGSYRICGRIMAAAYSQLCPEEIKRIFIFGQTEQFLPFICGLSSCDYLDTPLGKLQIDEEVNSHLLNTGDFRLLDLPFETKERSVEMQLPFIAKVMKNRPYMFNIIPVYVGTLSHEHQSVVAQRFLPYLKDPSSAFIFSTSLCHWGKIFGFDSKVESLTTLDSIKSFDEKAITALRELRSRPFEEFLYDNKVKVFDHRVINICLWLVQLFLTDDKFSIIQMDEEKQLEAFVRTAKFNLMGQAWSLPGVREEDNCVSYISAAISFDCRKYIPEEEPDPNPLNKQC